MCGGGAFSKVEGREGILVMSLSEGTAGDYTRGSAVES